VTVNLEKVLADSLGKHVLLFADCVPVKGHTASAIYDLTRGRISTFPSEYFPLFELFRTQRLGPILAAFSEDDRANLHVFLGFLLDNEYVAFVDDLAPFLEIPSAWDAPCSIQNAIIDVNTQRHDYRKIVSELDVLRCEHLQVRSYSALFTVPDLVELARLCHGTSIQTLQAVIPHDPVSSDDDYVSVVTSNRILIGLVVHSANENRRIRVDHGARGTSAELVAVEIEMTTKKLESALDCGSISKKELLRPSTSTFNELHHFNGCLNRKISVDENGQVRNCPAMRGLFGHHRSTALSDIVAGASFQRAWRARKDEIKICQDCQYRYACTDCRAFLEDPDTEDSRPLKCGYDPYTDSWIDWRERPGAAATWETYRKRRHLPVLKA
jgi:SPASM domain peptide maturase of grasp-with-spasm system